MGLHLSKVLLHKLTLIVIKAYVEGELILRKSHIRLEDFVGVSINLCHETAHFEIQQSSY